jgi:outer membrane protein TolC
MRQYLPSGGQISLSYQMQNSDYIPRRYLRNNYFDSQVKLQLNQPLLREFGYEVNWARITIARNDQRISLLDFRKSLEDNTNELEKDYWQLFEGMREVQIQERLLEGTRDLGQILWRQFIVGGQATEVEASQAAAQIRTREAVLVRARARVRDISDDIKRRMNDPSLPVASNITILPADDPNVTPIVFDLQDQIDTAMNNRLELGQQQLRVDSAEVASKVALNGLWPKLDFVSSVALQGLSSNLSNAISDQFGDTHLIFSLGFQLEIPLGNREARAILRRAQLQRMQAVEEYRNIAAKVSQDVSTDVREIDTTWGELRAHRQARYHFEAQLQGLINRRVGGVQFTPESVQLELDAQERLAQSQRDEANAIAAYNTAVAKLEHDKGTILRYNNILMVEERAPWNLPKTAPKPPLGHLPQDLRPQR